MKRPVQHETDAAGQRLLRAAFEGFGWVVNAVENDYGADYEVEIFEGGLSTRSYLQGSTEELGVDAVLV